jgi:tether containing UBX domain for GLUT4
MGLTLVLRSMTPSAVSIALQLPPGDTSIVSGKPPDGGRLVYTFRSDTTLWRVLRQFEDVVAPTAGCRVSLTGRGAPQLTTGSGASGAGQVFWETPVLTLLRREVSTLDEFGKTLAQLGHNSGRVLARVSFRRTDRPLADAMAEVEALMGVGEEAGGTKPTATPEEKGVADEGAQAEEKKASTGEEAKDVAMADSVQPAQEAASAADTAPAESTPAPAHPPTSDQPAAETTATSPPPSEPIATIERIGVYSPTASTTIHAAQIKDPDSAFVVSIAQAQAHQAHLAAAARNKRLLSDDEIAAQEADKAARLARIASVDMRVRFPDNWCVDWRCSPAATGADVYSAVREVATPEARDHEFKLTLPDRTTLKDVEGGGGAKETLVRGYKLSGRVLANFGWADGVPDDVRWRAKQAFLRDDLRGQAQTIEVPKTPEPEPEEEEETRAVAPKLTQGEGSKDGAGEKKVPKWMRLSKK